MNWDRLLLLLLLLFLGLLLKLRHELAQRFLGLLEIKRMLTSTSQKQKDEDYKKMENNEKQLMAHKGLSMVESVHKTLSGVTFGLLDSMDSTRDTSKVVKDIHDATAVNLYHGIRTFSNVLIDVASDIMKSDMEKSTTRRVPPQAQKEASMEKSTSGKVSPPPNQKKSSK
ncbi:hypothetical protein WDW89_06010 [Deltaproteobacteria bacterium TL4]